MQILRTPLLTLALLLASLCAQVGATAQLQAPNRLDVVERIDALCPGYIAQDHAFTDTVATVLRVGAVLRPSNDREAPLVVVGDDRWGRNGKRGNPNDPSHDAIAFKNPAVPFGVSIVDMIGGAGGPSPSPAWIDQTAETLRLNTTGVLVAPSGRLPACLTAGSTPPPPGQTPPPPVSTPPPAPDLAPVLAQLAALRAGQETLAAAIAALSQREPVPPDALLAAYVEAMVGAGPGGDPAVPNHITDLKQRLDVIRASLEQLAAWLRGRAVLRY